MDVVAFLLFYGLALIVAIYIHEAGHVIGGRLIGFQIRRATLGRGPVMLRRRISETEIVIRVIPFGGMIQIYPALLTRVHEYLLFLAAGALSNATVLALVLAFFPWSGDLDWTQGAAWGSVAAQIAVILMTMVPYKTEAGGSDGLKILAMLRAGKDSRQHGNAYASMLQAYGLPPSEMPFSKASTRLYYWMRQMETATSRQEASSALLRELSRDGLSPAETLLVLDGLVTNQLLYRDLGIDDQMDELSARALVLAPHLATLRGSRGATLVEIGRYEDGAALLSPLAIAAPTFDSLVSLLFLARAEHALGKKISATALLETARALLETYSPKEAVALFARTERELGG